VTEENKEELKRLKAQRRADYLQRIPIEGKFGQEKNGYNLNDIRAKRAGTSEAWINSIFLVMNLLILLRIFFALCIEYVVALVALLLPTGRACCPVVGMLGGALPAIPGGRRQGCADFMSRL